ncbi:MAG: hypothetical protein IJ881_06270, partial [Neisseriaceae bacterium]|nr:hypothetical protein [Neisseriaceae bacterium]
TADAIGSYAIGNNNVIGSANAYALGSNITATAKNSVFLGDNAAYVKAKDDLSAGSTAGTTEYSRNLKDIKNTAGKTVIDSGSLNFAGSGSADNGVVSVGAKDKERRIQNVAAGLIDEHSTDAINGSQLYSVLQNLDTSINTDNRNVGLATIDGTQTIVSPYINVDGVETASGNLQTYLADKITATTNWNTLSDTDKQSNINTWTTEFISNNSFAQATGQHAVAIGYGSKAQGDNSVAFMGNTAQGTNAMVWGGNANAGLGGDYVNSISTYQDGQYSSTHTVVDWTSYVRNGVRYYKLTYDDNTIVEKTLAQLQQNAVFTMKDSAESGKNATAFGQGTIATGQNATAFGLRTIAGNFTDANGNPVTINATDNNYQVIAQDGTVIATATNFRTLLENHKVVDVSNGNNQDNQVAWGEKTFASGKNATAFGFKTRSTAENSTAWGHKTSATNNRATAFGIDTEASGRNSTAFGNITHATNENATAWGSNTQATGIGSTAWGSYTVAGGDNSTAWGNKSVVGSGSFAIQKMDSNGDPMFDPNGNPVNDNYTNLSIQFDSTNEMYYVQAVDEQGKTVTLAGDKSKYPNALIEPQNEDWTRP